MQAGEDYHKRNCIASGDRRWTLILSPLAVRKGE